MTVNWMKPPLQEPNFGEALIGALVVVAMAIILGVFLKRQIIGNKKLTNSAIHTGQKWAAYVMPVVVLASTHRFIKFGFIEGLVGLIINILIFSILAFVLGWFFRSIFPIKAPGAPQSEIAIPSVVPSSQRSDSFSSQQSSLSNRHMSNAFQDKTDLLDEDKMYLEIANELETNSIDKGLWTRLFVKCDGDNNKTKLMYITERMAKLTATANSQIQAKLAAQVAENDKQRLFQESQDLKLAALVSKFESGTALNYDDVLFLVEAANNQKMLVNLQDKKDGYSLLHWCAVFGMDQSATTLLRLGANAAAKDFSGRWPSELTRARELSKLLESAAIASCVQARL